VIREAATGRQPKVDFAFFFTFKDLRLTLRHGLARRFGRVSENVGFSEGYAAKSA
jgi:hypothetical protein